MKVLIKFIMSYQSPKLPLKVSSLFLTEICSKSVNKNSPKLPMRTTISIFIDSYDNFQMNIIQYKRKQMNTWNKKVKIPYVLQILVHLEICSYVPQKTKCKNLRIHFKMIFITRFSSLLGIGFLNKADYYGASFLYWHS